MKVLAVAPGMVAWRILFKDGVLALHGSLTSPQGKTLTELQSAASSKPPQGPRGKAQRLPQGRRVAQKPCDNALCCGSPSRPRGYQRLQATAHAHCVRSAIGRGIQTAINQ